MKAIGHDPLSFSPRHFRQLSNRKSHHFSQSRKNQVLTSFRTTFISYCLSDIWNGQKYKALILKYVPCILKYMACIFCDKPCVFSCVPQQHNKVPKFIMNFGTFINFKEYVLHHTPKHATRISCKCRVTDARSSKKPHATANAILSGSHSL